MTKLRLGHPYWLSAGPSRRLPRYSMHRGTLTVDVAILGGGITGCMAAYVFAGSGTRVALLEKHRVAHGSTAASTALLMSETDVDFRELENLYGLRATKKIWNATRRSTLDLAATVRRLGIRCGLEPQDSVYVSTISEHLKALRKEFEARKAAGVDVRWLKAEKVRARTGLEALGGILSSGNAQFDPVRACAGFARAAVARGAIVFENSAAVRIKTGRRGVEIRTERGSVQASRVLVATGYATPEFRPLARHFKMMSTFVVVTPPLPMAIRRECGRRNAMIWDTEWPYHYLRWIDDERVMFGGADLPRVPERRREKVLVQRTGQLMYELSRFYPALSGIQPDYAWDGLFAQSVDGLPFIGTHRNYPHHLFALGYGGNGMTFAYLAARLLLRQYQGVPAKGDELFGFKRWSQGEE